MYSCESESRIRIVRVNYPDWPENKTRCEVVYDKSGESLGEKVLWQAQNTRDYCSVKAKKFAQRLETLGWDCGIASEERSVESSEKSQSLKQPQAGAPVIPAIPSAPATPEKSAQPTRSVAGTISKPTPPIKKAPAVSSAPVVAAPVKPQAPAEVTTTSVATKSESCRETPASIAWRESDPTFPGGEWECESYGKTRTVVSNYDARNGLRVIYRDRPFDLETDERINTLNDMLEWRKIPGTNGNGYTSLIYQIEHQIDTQGGTAAKYVVTRFAGDKVCTIGVVALRGSAKKAQVTARAIADDPSAKCVSPK